jgi:hypothetical protein
MRTAASRRGARAGRGSARGGADRASGVCKVESQPRARMVLSDKRHTIRALLADTALEHARTAYSEYELADFLGAVIAPKKTTLRVSAFREFELVLGAFDVLGGQGSNTFGDPHDVNTDSEVIIVLVNVPRLADQSALWGRFALHCVRSV